MLQNTSTHFFDIGEMSCQSCVGTIRGVLENNPHVLSHTVSLCPPRARVTLAPNTSPASVIELIEEVGYTASEILLSNEEGQKGETYYFKIDPLPDQAVLRRLQDCLGIKGYVRRVDIHLGTARVKVEMMGGTPRKIIEVIKQEVNLKAEQISSKNEVTHHFSLKGLHSRADATALFKAMHTEERAAYVKTCSVSYASKRISVTTLASGQAAEEIAFRRKISEDIRKALPNANIIPEWESSFHETPFKNRAQKYLHHASINLAVGIPLFLFGALIPLPITLFGQCIGLLLGAGMLGVMAASGRDFYQDAWKKFVTSRRFNMNTLITLGTGSAWTYSMMIAIAPLFFPVAALQYQFLAINMVLCFVNIGKYLKEYAQEKTAVKIKDLRQTFRNLQMTHAKKLSLKDNYDPHFFDTKNLANLGRHLEEIPYKEIKEGDIIQVKQGERFPVEGIIVSHSMTYVQQKNLTGEALDVRKGKGSAVISGSLNKTEDVYIRANIEGSKGKLTSMIEAVEKADNEDTTLSKKLDDLATIFVPMIIGLALLTAIGWGIFGPSPALPWMIKNGMSVCLCFCPCALGLAVPISMSFAFYSLFNKGIVVIDASAIEAASAIDTVVFDKTGTLTAPVVRGISVEENQGWRQDSIRQYVISLEKACLKKNNSENKDQFGHPIARAFARAKSSLPLFECDQTLIRKSDQGIFGVVNGKNLYVGSLAHIQAQNITVSEDLQKKEAANAAGGLTSVYVAIDGQCVAVIGLIHEVRPEAKEMITGLKSLGMDVFMLTGDKEAPAKVVANHLGIPDSKVLFECDSNRKADYIRRLMANNRRVAMVGDGFNDLPAVKAADLGIAMGPWTDASSTAKVAIENLNLCTLFLIARATRKNIMQNLWWTGFYNLISLTAACGLFYPLFGFVFSPILASLTMGLSSLFVVVNSSRLFYEIDRTLARFKQHTSRSKPMTRWERLKETFSLVTLGQTLKGFIVSDPGAEQGGRMMKETPNPTANASGKIKVKQEERTPPLLLSPSRYPSQLKIEEEEEEEETPPLERQIERQSRILYPKPLSSTR